MKELRVGDKVRITDQHRPLLTHQQKYIKQYGSIFRIEKISVDVSWGHGYYAWHNTSGFAENQLTKIYGCFCDDDKEFLPSCFECIEKFYP